MRVEVGVALERIIRSTSTPASTAKHTTPNTAPMTPPIAPELMLDEEDEEEDEEVWDTRDGRLEGCTEGGAEDWVVGALVFLKFGFVGWLESCPCCQNDGCRVGCTEGLVLAEPKGKAVRPSEGFNVGIVGTSVCGDATGLGDGCDDGTDPALVREVG